MRESVNCFFSILPFMRQPNEMHIVKGLMFCGMESFKLDVPGLVMANIYKKKKDIPYKIRVLKIVLREGGKKKQDRKYRPVCLGKREKDKMREAPAVKTAS